MGEITIFSVCSAAELFRLTDLPSSAFSFSSPSSPLFFSFESVNPVGTRDRTSEKRRVPVEARRFVNRATPVTVREEPAVVEAAECEAAECEAAIFDRSINEMRRLDFCAVERGTAEAEAEAETEAETEAEVETVETVEGTGAERLSESFSGREGCDMDCRDVEAEVEVEPFVVELEMRVIPTVLNRRLITGLEVSIKEPKESRNPSEERRDRSDRFSASKDSIFFCDSPFHSSKYFQFGDFFDAIVKKPRFSSDIRIQIGDFIVQSRDLLPIPAHNPLLNSSLSAMIAAIALASPPAPANPTKELISPSRSSVLRIRFLIPASNDRSISHKIPNNESRLRSISRRAAAFDSPHFDPAQPYSLDLRTRETAATPARCIPPEKAVRSSTLYSRSPKRPATRTSACYFGMERVCACCSARVSHRLNYSAIY